MLQDLPAAVLLFTMTLGCCYLRFISLFGCFWLLSFLCAWSPPFWVWDRHGTALVTFFPVNFSVKIVFVVTVSSLLQEGIHLLLHLCST